MDLDGEAVHDLILEMERQFGGKGDSASPSSRGLTMWQRIRWRRAHLQRHASVDPPLPETWKDAQKYQIDDLRRVFTELLARGTENHYIGKVSPLKDTATERDRANLVETVMNSGDLFIEERSGIEQNLQAGLLSGLINDCYGIVHWCKAEHLMPPVPEAEYMEEPPEDEKGDYEEEPLDEREAVAEAEETLGYIDRAERRRQRKYREKDASREKRWKGERAKAGYPWWEETVDPLNFAFTEDKSLENGMSRVLIARDVPISDYVDGLRADKDATGKAEEAGERSLAEVTKGKVHEYGLRNGPQWWEPSAEDWGKTLRVYQLWTRTEFYECVGAVRDTTDTGGSTVEGDGAFRCVKAFKHPYKMPPFAVAPFMLYPGSDPVDKFLPMLDGLQNLKPAYDRLMTLYLVLAEQVALPWYYWKNVRTNEEWQDEQGKTKHFRANSANEMVAPPGYELAMLPLEMNPVFIQALEFMSVQIEQATPPTGFSQVGASTQPWTIRLDQQQQSVMLKKALKSVATALAVMRRNQAYVMSLDPDQGGFGGPICVYGREIDKDGDIAIDYSEVKSVEAKDVRSLNVSVSIDAITSAERITIVEHGATLLQAGPPDAAGRATGLITKADFFENYLGKGDPDEYMAGLDAEEIFETQVKPGLIAQEVARTYGSKVVLGPDGEFINGTGETVDSATVIQNALAAQGLDPMTIQIVMQTLVQALSLGQGSPAMGGAPQAPPPPPQGVMPTVPGMGASPGGLAPLTTPGTLPMRGMVG